MIKLHASYSKKIPAESQYSSKSFHASLEVEVADEIAKDGDQLQQKLRTIWRDLQTAVEAQIQESNGNPAPMPPAVKGQAPENGNDRASPRQINYLTLLGRKAKNWGLAELESFVKNRFGNSGIYDLSKAEASMLIEEFRGMTSGQGGRR
ncbi:MAG: hypothetical protein O7H41_17605 [Planctomycetota bacterium]|nr:hypothetical protein [Planctomycetota bacterium]